MPSSASTGPVFRSGIGRSCAAIPSGHLYPGIRVTAFLGDDRLSRVRLESVDGSSRLDLAVDGVFLEIGLAPNSLPVQGLVPRNEAGEIPVNRDQSTILPGFFAAGDVTDEADKQIVIAAGAGARAALTANRYLFASGSRTAGQHESTTMP